MTDEHNAHCIEDCLEASELCEEAAAHCVRRGGSHADRVRVDALILAAAVGAFLADQIEQQSVLARPTVEFLADACRRAAVVCRELPGDELLAGCADACDRCADCAPRMLVARDSV